MTYTTVYEIAARLHDQFHIDMPFDQVVSNSALALKLIRRYVLERQYIYAEASNYEACLNCCILDIKSVTRSSPPINYPIISDKINQPHYIFFKESTMIPDLLDTEGPTKSNYVNSINPTGNFIDYVWDSPYLRFNEMSVGVQIEAISIKLDKESYPVIPEDCLEGCVYYCLFVHYQFLFITGQCQPVIFQQIERWKNDKINQSRPFRLSRNESDKAFNILTSMDRKSFNVPT